jgi:hypothetical protein
MLAAQAASAEDSLLATVLGFGLLALFIAVLVAARVLRWRRRGFAPRLRRLRHPLAARRGSSTAPSTFTGGQPTALPEVTAANAAAAPMPSGGAP